MFVYLDEAGDTGFKFDKGSSAYFVVTVLLVDDPIPLNAAIDDFRKELKYPETHEFKFYHSKDEIRHAFLRRLHNYDVIFRALVVDKQKITRPYLQKREVFYSYLVRMLLDHDSGRIRDVILVLDEREKGKRNKQSLATYLRRHLNTSENGFNKIRDVKYHQSHRDNLIHVADMVAGAVYAKYAKGNNHYCNIIKSKLDDIWLLQTDETQ